jgi:hypothetical protein
MQELASVLGHVVREFRVQAQSPHPALKGYAAVSKTTCTFCTLSGIINVSNIST